MLIIIHNIPSQQYNSNKKLDRSKVDPEYSNQSMIDAFIMEIAGDAT
jgi:hypothetical protein